MKGHKKQEWIETGYELVSRIGFLNLNIESFAREMGKSKSSFYHYFGDKEAFELDLLDYHLAQIERYSQDILRCESIRPDFLNILLELKVDMFFQKQVRL
ncbi:MAG: TetR/AcrR family transcriptional regulator, partial [Bacteroidota bacterium]